MPERHQRPHRRCGATRWQSTTTDQRLLDSRGPSDWVHTDPWRVLRIQSEFVEGFGALAELGPAISRVRLRPHARRRTRRTPQAEEIGRRWSAAGFAVITGGGPGVMEAANKGAGEAGGVSVGLGIELPFEPGLNEYVDLGLNFRYFFARKTMFVKYAQGFIVLPGRLRHLRRAVRGAHPGADPKVTSFPVVLIGTSYWPGWSTGSADTVLADGKVSAADLDMFRITDDVEEAVDGDGRGAPAPRQPGSRWR